jgi:trimethylamine:corrinoid methyltransferase-like protein
MISGAGMLDFLACHSLEKLVIDAEAIASAQRLLEGIQPRTESLALAMFVEVGLQGDFLKLKETRALFRAEQHFPSEVIDRGMNLDGLDVLGRARQRVEQLIGSYERPTMSSHQEEEILHFAEQHARAAGLTHLPGVNRSTVGVH